MKKVRISAPATIANVGPGYDIFAMALENPRDDFEISINESGKINLEIENNTENIPLDISKNTAGLAIQEFIRKFDLSIGVNVKILWSFDHDKRPLSEEQKNQNLEFYSRLVNKHKELYNLSSKMKGLEMKFLHKKIPTYYNILDQKRIIIILQHPIKPYKAFACMNVLDPNFAKELRKKFLNVWLYEALTS